MIKKIVTNILLEVLLRKKKKKGFESIGKKGRVSWAGTFTQKAIPRDALVKV